MLGHYGINYMDQFTVNTIHFEDVQNFLRVLDTPYVNHWNSLWFIGGDGVVTPFVVSVNIIVQCISPEHGDKEDSCCPRLLFNFYV